jgi:hypothetical protein
MDPKNNFSKSVHPLSVSKLMAIGGGIAFILIIIFLLPVPKAKPEWPALWMIKPLIVVPVAGAMAGIFYYFMDHLRFQGGWKKFLANIFSLIAYIIALWMGTILGLHGTLWN